MHSTKIEWCDSTWNPVTGCLHKCEYCYARRIAHRFGGEADLNETCIELNTKPKTAFPYGFQPTLHRYRLEEPKKFKKQQNVFVCSMGDLFGPWVPHDWQDEVFTACGDADRHKYLLLTKYPEGIDPAIDSFVPEERGGQDSLEFFDIFWFGTTITCEEDLGRVDILSKIEEGHRFLSIEPLHGPIKLEIKKDRCPVCGSSEVYQENPRTSTTYPWYCDCCGEWESVDGDDLKPSIEWVIIGAETGNRKGRVIPNVEWIISIVDQCRAFGVPVFMKDSLAPIIGEKNMIREFPGELQR
ncbi:MAG TPA: DUF5131 family protein [Bacillota bacterium]|nr:DUF5131 family protein [Bacillota bacterium]